MTREEARFVSRIFTVLLTVICVFVLVRNNFNTGDDYIDYTQSLDLVAVTVDGEDITLRDMAFYIAYDENTVEEQALIYDPEDTSKYWNLKGSDTFNRLAAKKATLDKAIHDEILYQMAVADGFSLTKEDTPTVDAAKMVFWNSVMTDEKLERMTVSKEDLDSTIERVALAQKYQVYLAEQAGVDSYRFDINMSYYEEILAEHDVDINSKVWDRVQYGEITLVHKLGVFNEEEE